MALSCGILQALPLLFLLSACGELLLLATLPLLLLLTLPLHLTAGQSAHGAYM